MKLIDVLNKQCNGGIRKGTKLIIDFSYEQDSPENYTYDGECFFDENHYEWFESYGASIETLNKEVELIPPKEKKFLVKLHIRGLLTIRNYLNYYNDGIKQWSELGSKSVKGFYQTCFTKQEMQDIKLVREFLEDMKGKYELVEVEDNEIY